jgi:hypothetical protein
MSRSKGKRVIIELSEHDALQILTLVRKELDRTDVIWRPYWERQVQEIRQSIEKAGLGQERFGANKKHGAA